MERRKSGEDKTAAQQAPVAPEEQKLDALIKNPSGPACDSDSNFIATKANVFSTVFSNGPAAYFYDAIEELLLSTFQSDLQADYDYFVSLSVTKPKIAT